MERIIRHITEQLVNLLPDDYEYYRLDELRSWDVPLFIIQRIRVELERNLAESMNPPKTDWANMESPSVRAVWEQFIEAIRQEARLPASYVRPVMETAVADVLDMLVQPRKNLPEVIFGADEELTYDQIVVRLDAIVVYRHFAALIPRYMQKKGLDKLTKERCTEIIANVDDRLTRRYSPLNWAQMLDPLFSLLNQRIDTNLLRLFFEDKQMSRLARQFDRLNTTVDRAQLIEVLSSPESLNMEGYEDIQPEVAEESRQDRPEEPGKNEKQKSHSGTNGELNNGESGAEHKPSSEKRSKHTSRKSVSGKDPVIDAFHEYRRNLKEREAESESNGGGSPHEEEHKRYGSRERNYLNDIFRNPDDENDAVMPDYGANEPAGKLPEQESNKQESGSDSSAFKERAYAEEDEEIPMWKRFLSPEERAEIEAREEEERLDEGEYTDGHRADPQRDPDSPGRETELLQKLFKDNRSNFISEIFRGSEQAYNKTVAAIVRKEDWKSASEYINREVFRKNSVDMYSEAAVDFTDRLHTYFLENRKS